MLFLIGAYSENRELFLDFRTYKTKKRAEYYFKKFLENVLERKIIVCRAIPFISPFNTLQMHEEFKKFIINEGELILGE